MGRELTEPVYFCRGVADPDLRAGYLADAGAVVAVRLSDGELLWRNDRADRPLIADADRLAAARACEGQRNAFEVVVLDGSGEVGLVSAPVVLPDWVTLEWWRPETFRLGANATGRRLRLHWEARARYSGGAAPSPSILAASAHHEAGAVEVDLESGAVSALETTAPGDVGAPPLAPEEGAEPWRVGTTIARLVWDVGEAEQAVALERGDASTGKAGDLVELMRGETLVAEVTPDGTHVFVRDEAGPDAWQVFSALTGRPVATLTHDDGAHSPVKLRERVFYLVGTAGATTPAPALRAREVESDAVLWELRLATPARRDGPAKPRLRQ